MTQSFGTLATFSNIIGEPVRKIHITPGMEDIVITATTDHGNHIFTKTPYSWFHETPDQGTIHIIDLATIQTLIVVTKDAVCEGIYF